MRDHHADEVIKRDEEDVEGWDMVSIKSIMFESDDNSSQLVSGTKRVRVQLGGEVSFSSREDDWEVIDRGHSSDEAK